MNRDEYVKMRAVEDTMWWYRGLHANLLAAARRARPPDGPVLDAGCGTGGFLRRLRRAMPGRVLIGLDREPLAAKLAAGRGDAPAAIGSVDRMPFPDAGFAAIFSADVLYHRAVDETAALAEFRRCLMPGGALVLNLPAYRWMSSAHDRAVHGVRRYTAGGIRTRLRDAGFRRIVCGYWNSLPFPLMAAKRKLLPGGREDSEVKPFPAPVNVALKALVGIETALIGSGVRLPFGGSVLAAAVA